MNWNYKVTERGRGRTLENSSPNLSKECVSSWILPEADFDCKWLVWQVLREAPAGVWGGERGQEGRQYSVREPAGSGRWGTAPGGPLGDLGVVPSKGEELEWGPTSSH